MAREKLFRQSKKFTSEQIQHVNKIVYEEQETEFDIQSELTHLLKQLGFIVRGEVNSLVLDFGKYHTVRLDLVVFNLNREAISIIECKRNPLKTTLGKRQLRRYSYFNLPLIPCFWDERCPFGN